MPSTNTLYYSQAGEPSTFRHIYPSSRPSRSSSQATLAIPFSPSRRVTRSQALASGSANLAFDEDEVAAVEKILLADRSNSQSEHKAPSPSTSEDLSFQNFLVSTIPLYTFLASILSTISQTGLAAISILASYLSQGARFACSPITNFANSLSSSASSAWGLPHRRSPTPRPLTSSLSCPSTTTRPATFDRAKALAQSKTRPLPAPCVRCGQSVSCPFQPSSNPPARIEMHESLNAGEKSLLRLAGIECLDGVHPASQLDPESQERLTSGKARTGRDRRFGHIFRHWQPQSMTCTKVVH